MPVAGGGGGPTLGLGLFGSTTTSALFVTDDLSYDPDIDPRLPKHTTLESNLLVSGNTVISTELVVGNISLVPQPSGGDLGYLRVGAYVWSYTNVHVANSTVSGLSNVLASFGGNLTAGNVISVLGVR